MFNKHIPYLCTFTDIFKSLLKCATWVIFQQFPVFLLIKGSFLFSTFLLQPTNESQVPFNGPLCSIQSLSTYYFLLWFCGCVLTSSTFRFGSFAWFLCIRQKSALSTLLSSCSDTNCGAVTMTTLSQCAHAATAIKHSVLAFLFTGVSKIANAWLKISNAGVKCCQPCYLLCRGKVKVQEKPWCLLRCDEIWWFPLGLKSGITVSA